MNSGRHTRRRGIGAKLLLSLTSLLLMLLALEVGYRLVTFGPGGLSPTRLRSVCLLGDDFLVDSEFTAIDYELAPDVSDWHMLHPFETNSHGQREDREYSPDKPPQTFRVAVIGDSYAMGWGAPVEAIYHSLIEQELNREPGPLNYEVINFGVAGYNLLHYGAVLEHKVRDWEPDLILLSVIVNDEPAPAFGYLRKIFPERTDLGQQQGSGRLAVVRKPFLRLTFLEEFPALGRSRLAGAPVGREALERQHALSEELSIRAALGDEVGGETDYVRAALTHIRNIAEGAGVPVFCVYLSTSDAEYRRAAARHFESSAEELGFGFLDTCSLSRGLSQREAEILPTDNHPSIEMHRRFAESLLEALRAGPWLEPR